MNSIDALSLSGSASLGHDVLAESLWNNIASLDNNASLVGALTAIRSTASGGAATTELKPSSTSNSQLNQIPSIVKTVSSASEEAFEGVLNSPSLFSQPALIRPAAINDFNRRAEVASDSLTGIAGSAALVGSSSTAQEIKINFQPNTSAVPAGYIKDIGQAYNNTRGFGWVRQDSLSKPTHTPLNLTRNTRDRNRAGINQRLDTLTHMQGNNVANFNGVRIPAAWEYALPSGTYNVIVSAGDRSPYDSQHTINVEGVNAINRFQSRSMQEYKQAAVQVYVTDGRLTIDAIGGINTKINYLEIKSVVPDSSSSTSPVIWAVPGLKRIGQYEQPGEKKSIELYAARGEYEPFQIGIRAPQRNLTNVNISVSDLYGPNNRTIPKTNLTLYREHYVHVSHSSPNWKGSTNPPLGPGWYADGLIPFVDPETKKDLTGAQLDAGPFNLEANRNQPIWVDMFVPRNAQPGQYTGTFTVTSDQGQTSGKVLLKVWDFELPLKPSLNSSFGYWQNMPKSANVELLKHKLMPKHVKLEDERELIDTWGLTSANLGLWSGGDHGHYKMDPAPAVEEFQEAVSWHQPDLFLYNYTADEIGGHPALYKPMKQWARSMHQAGVDNLVTMAPVPELYNDGSRTGRSAVDIWVSLPTMYDEAPDRVAEVLQKGDQVWFYNALVQDGYSPKWQIDFEPINFRIPHGFINQSLGLTGALYWRADLWTNNPWNNVQTYFSNNHHYPGEGMLVYPGEQVGVQGIVPSMRLKWLREGVEDYEYIEILKGLGRKEWALAVSREAGLDWKNWTRDPNVLESARRKLGEEIEKLF